MKWKLSIVVVLFLVFSLIVSIISILRPSEPTNTMANQEETNEPTNPPTNGQTPTAAVSDEEKAAIDTWIAENDLNEFGDPKDTVYAGGTPLFNEGTGEYTDKYEHIVSQHPDKPWNN